MPVDLKAMDAVVQSVKDALPSDDTINLQPGPPASMLSKEDRLEAENLQLRSMLLITNKSEFLRQTEKAIEERFDKPLSALRAEMTKFQAHLSAKYGIDFKTQEIEPGTGCILTVKTDKK